MALFSIRINSRWRPPPSWISSNGHISATAHDILIQRASRGHLCDSTAFLLHSQSHYIETRQLCRDCGYIKLPCQQDMFTYFFTTIGFYSFTLINVLTLITFDIRHLTMKRAKFSKPRDTGESHGILKNVRRSIATVDEDTTGNQAYSLEYAYFVIGLFHIAPIARHKTARVTL